MTNNTPDYKDNLYSNSQNIKDEQQKDLCITVEKQVWESTLNRSMVLEAENAQLKELLKECSHYVNNRLIETRERLNKPYTVTDKILHKKAEKLLTKIDEALK